MLPELFLLALLAAAVAFALRRGPAKIDEPLIFGEPGRYHVTLAPQLAFARELVEQLAQHLSAPPLRQGETPTLFFTVHHPRPDGGIYLLALAFRRGICFIQVISPRPMPEDSTERRRLISDFSSAVLQHYPPQTCAENHAPSIALSIAAFLQSKGVTADGLHT